MSATLSGLMPHLIAAPILVPMVAAAVLLLIPERLHTLKVIVHLLACVAGLVIAVGLVDWVQHAGGAQAVGIYLPANWPVPYGIVLVVDRLSSMMVLLTAVLGLAAFLYASARWDRAGVHFHSLFQLQLMGLYGAFLTGDLFNLFVFFEILLTASYGLLLHGSGWPRVQAGLHFVAVNLVASALLLIGIALLYSVTGSLNLADMANMVPHIPADDRGLLHAGAAILGVAFLVKAAAWPLNAWLAPAYSAAAAPVAALFAIMTKVGLYALLRVWSLLFQYDAGASSGFGADIILAAGLITLVLAAVALLAARRLNRIAAFAVVVSSGTLLAAIGFGSPRMTGAALYYTLSSTLALAALFLVSDLMERARATEESVPILRRNEGDAPFIASTGANAPLPRTDDDAIDDDNDALNPVGRPIPAAMAFLGGSFILCALLVAGLPPLSGFLGKAAMIAAALEPEAMSRARASDVAPATSPVWIFIGLLVTSGFVALLALSGVGVRQFWAPRDRPAPPLRVIESAAIGLLLLASVLMVWQVDAVLRFTQAAGHDVHHPQGYVGSMLSVKPKPSPGAVSPNVSRAGGSVPLEQATMPTIGGNRP